jgi:phage-related protein
MKNLPTSLLIEKNKLATSNAWLLLADIVLPDNTTFNLARNNEDVTWNSKTYYKFPFDLDWPEENTKGEIPTAQLLVSNVTRALLPYLRQYNGGIGSMVTLHLVNSGYLSSDTSDLDLEFQIVGASDDANWITWKLGGKNLLKNPFPSFRYMAGICRWVRVYQGAECGYAGSLPSCAGHIDDCRLHQNSPRFGGEPGLEAGGLRIV